MVATLSTATRHLRNNTLDPAHHHLVSMARRLQVLPAIMAHHLLDLLPGNTSRQLLISKRPQDLQRRPAPVTFLDKCQI